jgi:hypothetical protein
MEYSDLENRFAYHAPKDEATKRAHERIREILFDVADEINDTAPEGREKSLAITHLEEAMMWANAAIARSN